ncbi:MAG: type II toxin-antitoxin system prevent-host-death family antitoxin [Deltaproteobacteria bacterium]|nr:type II toxin-antitoxin system prevent-host-death family antitoxin [Deltaproteobacteria bacterium]
MEINVKEARARLSFLLKKVEKGDEILLLRRGKKVARLVPVQTPQRSLPSLKEFRSSIQLKGKPLSAVVVESREKERF